MLRTMNKKLDQYLSENLPDLMDEHKIADRSDLQEVDKQFEGLEQRMDDLEGWKTAFSNRIVDNRKRMDRLKTKYGVE